MSTIRGRHAFVATVLALSLVACDGSSTTGGGENSSQDASPSAAPAVASATPTTPTPSSSPSFELDAQSQACIDAFVTFLADIEDLVAGFDFAHMTLSDYRDFVVAQAPAGRKLYDRLKGQACVDAAGAPPEALRPYIEGLVLREAPGSMPYLDLLLAMRGLGTTGTCRKDRAALLRYIRDGGTVSDLAIPERFHVFNLAASVDFRCGLRGAVRFFDRDDVATFLEVL